MSGLLTCIYIHMILCINCNNTWYSMQVQHYSMFTKLCSSTSCVPRVCKGEGGTVEFTMTCSKCTLCISPSISPCLPLSLPVFLPRYVVMTLNSLFREKCPETWRMECLLLVSITSQSELKQFCPHFCIHSCYKFIAFPIISCCYVMISFFNSIFSLLASLTQLSV